jgi:hypothetical protein
MHCRCNPWAPPVGRLSGASSQQYSCTSCMPLANTSSHALSLLADTPTASLVPAQPHQHTGPVVCQHARVVWACLGLCVCIHMAFVPVQDSPSAIHVAAAAAGLLCAFGPCFLPDGFQAIMPDCTSTAWSRSAAAESCRVPMVGLHTHSTRAGSASQHRNGPQCHRCCPPTASHKHTLTAALDNTRSGQEENKGGGRRPADTKAALGMASRCMLLQAWRSTREALLTPPSQTCQLPAWCALGGPAPGCARTRAAPHHRTPSGEGLAAADHPAAAAVWAAAPTAAAAAGQTPIPRLHKTAQHHSARVSRRVVVAEDG